MKFTKLRSKSVLIPAVATLAVLGAGAGVWTATASDDVRGSDRDRIAAVAVESAGGGTAVDVERSDDRGEAYEVEVQQDEGTEVDVALDDDLDVVAQHEDGTDDDSRDDDRTGDDGRDDDRIGDDSRDADDRALTDAERTSAEQAALDAVGSGTVVKVEADDDGSEAYEVEVRAEDGSRWDVTLDADFAVLEEKLDD